MKFNTEKAVNYFIEYLSKYKKEAYYKTYSMETFILDMIYGVGLAVQEGGEDLDFQFSKGFQKFQKVLIELFKNRRLNL